MEKGDTILVEQAWEDEGGYYHDEHAIIESMKPFKLRFISVNNKVRKFLSSCDFSDLFEEE